jgi:hypothetical protein
MIAVCVNYAGNTVAIIQLLYLKQLYLRLKCGGLIDLGGCDESND